MNPIVLLAAQLLVILAVTRVCGRLAQICRQPRVLGEIGGGILLGPVALGRLWPAAGSLLFAPQHLHGLEIVSNAGLVLFLLLTGAELDLKGTASSLRSVVMIPLGSIAVPFLAGLALAAPLAARFQVPPHARTGFSIFVGIAMSITALPVLVRILTDRQEAGRPVEGGVASSSVLGAAINDVFAWCGLASLLALLHRGDAASALPGIAMLAGFAVLMLVVVRPLLTKCSLPEWASAIALAGLAGGCAWVTNALGVHLFFGAFLAGICAPSGWLTSRAEHLLRTIALWTLPAFFAMTGLRMQPRLFDSSGWSWLMVVLGVAVLGKVTGSMAGALAGGMPWGAALRIGVLMNTRGLVELIVLNAGYQQGILSGAVFTLFVLMAVITTAMTGPLLDLLDRYRV